MIVSPITGDLLAGVEFDTETYAYSGSNTAPSTITYSLAGQITAVVTVTYDSNSRVATRVRTPS